MSKCPRCGSLLPKGILEGICPACAWRDLDLIDSVENESIAPGVLFRVAGHEVLEEISRGGAGVVYRARQAQPAREVALKMLLPYQSGSSEMRERFRMESTTIASLDHPAILPIYATGEYDGLPWFTMKLATGGSLADAHAKFRRKWRDIAALMVELADAVHYAHSRGVLHRDLKPGNVLFDEGQRAHVTDFGLAKFTSAAGDLTRAATVMGTPVYMAPEIILQGAAASTTSSDVYALGAMLYELLAGRPPFASKVPTALLKQVTEQAPEKPSRFEAGVPRDLEVIALHCLEKGPNKRYQSAAALSEDLSLWLAGRSIRAKPTGFGEETWRWARRNPTLATVAAVLLLTLTVGSALLVSANRGLQKSLADSLVARARAVRQSGREGQRFEALALLQEATRLHPTSEARDEAIAALTLPDWRPAEVLQLWKGAATSVTPSFDFSKFLVERPDRKFQLFVRGEEKARWQVVLPEESASISIFSPAAKWIAVRLRNDELYVLNAASGETVLRLADRPYAFKEQVSHYGDDMAFSPDGNYLATNRPEGGVSFFRLPDGMEERVWPARQWVTTMKFSPDGTLLAVGGGRKRSDALLAVIDVARATTLVQETPNQRVEFVEWTPDGSRLATRAVGGNAEVRTVSDLRIVATLPDRASLHGRFLSDGNRLLLTEQVGSTRLWEVDSGALLLTKKDEGAPANFFAAHPLRQWRAVSAGPVWITELARGSLLRKIPPAAENFSVPQTGWPTDVSKDGRFLAVGGWGGGAIVRLDADHAAKIISIGPSSSAGVVRFDPDGDAIWVSLADSGLFRHSFTTRESEIVEIGPGDSIDTEKGYYVTASNAPSGRLALVNPGEGLVKIVDTRGRRILARWPHPGAYTAEFSPDGKHVVVNGIALHGGEPATVRIADTGAIVRVLGTAPGRCARWSPDGTWVLAGAAPDKMKLWRAANGEPGPSLPPHLQNPNNAVAFSADGRFLAVLGTNEVSVVETASGAIVSNLLLPTDSGHAMDLRFVGADRLVAVFLNGSVLIWNLAEIRKELETMGLNWMK